MQMIHLDTHVVLWLFANDTKKFPGLINILIEANDLYICPAVMLELQYLHEIGRINYQANNIIEDLKGKVDLRIDDLSFEAVIHKAMEIQWTRDPFDRLIAAATIARNCPLITKDESILLNLPLAVWNRELHTIK